MLVPAKRSERDRYRRGRVLRRLRHVSWLFARLSREGRALCTMASLTLFLGADVGRSEAHILPLATLALIAAGLLVSRAYRASALVSRLHVPQRVAVGEELEIGIDLLNDGARELCELRIEPPLLPWDGQFTELPRDVETLAGGGRQRASARARFVARGAHHLDPFRVAALVPLRLAQGPAHETQGASFIVVPRVARVSLVSAKQNRRHQPGAWPAPRARATRPIWRAFARIAPVTRCAICTRARGRATARRWCASTRRSTSRASAWWSTPTRGRGPPLTSRARCRSPPA